MTAVLVTFAGRVSIRANENRSWKDILLDSILFYSVTHESYSMDEIHAQTGGCYACITFVLVLCSLACESLLGEERWQNMREEEGKKRL